MANTEQTVDCATHGTRPQAFMCQHLLSGEKLGFNLGYDEDEGDLRYPDAWCNACEEAWQAEGEWNETSMAFANIKSVCSDCYESARTRNWLQDDDAWQDLVSRSCAELSEKQQHFQNEFKIGEHDRWDRDPETGILTLSTDGQVQVEARYHVAGTYSLRSNTWMWAWANDIYSQKERFASNKARRLGEEKKFFPLVAHFSEATQEDTYHYAAILAEAIGAIGFYNTLQDDRWLIMLVTEARWVKKKKLFGLFG